jgi:phytoene synthase
MVSAFVPREPDPVLARAYRVCGDFARGHYENFPVASLLLPKRMRRPVAAIYAFARQADDFADEGTVSDADRLGRLDEWNSRLQSCLSARPAPASTEDLIFHALADTIRTHALPLGLFEALLSAFRQDVLVKRYATWEDVLDYCSRSANPIGRLVLRVGGYDHATLDRASDAVCTALQLTNFWQDFARDWANGRLYVPLADRDRAGARDADLDRGSMTPEWRAALRDVSRRTRALFAAGREVCDAVDGRLKLELRLTWLGGCRILERLERQDFDVFHERPRLTAGDLAPLVWRVVSWPPD